MLSAITTELAAAAFGALLPAGALYLRIRRLIAHPGIAVEPAATERMLRPPGHGLSKKLDAAINSFIDRLGLASLCSALATMALVITLRTLGLDASWWMLAMLVVPTLALCGIALWLTVSTLKLVQVIRRLRLELRGERIVGEVLNGVGAGCRVFHDFPGGDNWNIDHVVIGPGGVFAVETKARRRKLLPGPSAAHKVRVEGDRIEYAHGFDEDAIPQARRNAHDLSTHLSRAVGRHVPVEPVVVLPGYFVERDRSATAQVMNPKYLVEFLRRLPPQLTTKEVDTLSLFVDRKCRDVEF
jgi:hypothetical protein